MYLYLNPLEIGIKKKTSFDFFLSSHWLLGWLDFVWVSEGLPSSGGLQLSPLNASELCHMVLSVFVLIL